MTLKPFAIVVAADRERGIGNAGTLPWRLPGDMAYFKRVTSEAAPGKRNAVIMGRKTFESIPPKFRPLRDRYNVVLSKASNAEQAAPETVWQHSLDDALRLLSAREDIDQVFVIGGGQLYQEAIFHPRCERVFITRVHATLPCDTFFPAFEQHFRLVTQDGPHRDNGLDYTFEVYQRSL